ncbi:GNAT family N-acetyltransferase [Ornithinimicrobium sp. Y1694]|uniref:GNAT family N-acetyltransferase n=1 Tax=Ornithinimicrobium sp. Y1694 TaxID=3418590 RepID=UPI003CFAB81D
MAWTWPVRVEVALPDGRSLVLRPLARRDRRAWDEIRQRNVEWLTPWEAGAPEREARADHVITPFHRLRRAWDRAGRDGLMLPLVIEVDGRLVGTMHLFDVMWGSRRAAWAGYWLAQSETGRGVATWALATLVDHAIQDVGLHRVEVAIRPENTRSIAVVQRLGMPEEGPARALMYVDGDWRDHRIFAVVAEDLDAGGYAPGGLLRLLRG